MGVDHKAFADEGVESVLRKAHEGRAALYVPAEEAMVSLADGSVFADAAA